MKDWPQSSSEEGLTRPPLRMAMDRVTGAMRWSRNATRLWIVGLVVLAAALTGTAGQAGAAQVAEPLFWKTPYSGKPDGKTKGYLKAATRSGIAARFLVVKERRAEGDEWLGLRLPTRPNRNVGWVRAEDFNVSRAKAKLIVNRDARTLTMFINGDRKWRTEVVVGKPSTPTPRGLFAIHDRHRVRDEYRPWIFETTAHSRKLRWFQGGPARIALHGRHGDLRVPWGIAASNGCIRTPDWALRSIRKQAPPGTPLRIK